MPTLPHWYSGSLPARALSAPNDALIGKDVPAKVGFGCVRAGGKLMRLMVEEAKYSRLAQSCVLV